MDYNFPDDLFADLRLLLNNVLDYDRIQSIIKDPNKIAATYKLMRIFLGKKVTIEILQKKSIEDIHVKDRDVK
jgi:hypothetical protein